MEKQNPHLGSSLDDFLKHEWTFEEVQAKALERALHEKIQESMNAASISKVKMAKVMSTSRSQLDRVLDPDNRTWSAAHLRECRVNRRVSRGVVSIGFEPRSVRKRSSATANTYS
jgi:antitoxin HicB